MTQSKNEISRSLNYSIVDGVGHAYMMGSGESYLMTFAISMGLSSFNLGLLASVPLIIASIFQVLIVDRLHTIHSRKKFCEIFIFGQALVWIAIFLIPQNYPEHKALGLIFAVTLFHATAQIISPVWNAWMGTLLNPRERGKYFGKRNRWRAVFQLIGFLIAGTILQYHGRDNAVWGFGIIFSLAMIARMISGLALHQMSDPHYVAPKNHIPFGLIKFVTRSPQNNFGRFVLFAFAILIATNIASPFFTAYMLRELQFSYRQLTAALGTSLLFQFLSFQSWGILGDRFGNHKILKVTSVGAATLPLLWLFSTNFWFILVFQALSGIFWSGFNLAAVNYIFDAVKPSNLPRCTAYYNFLGNMGVCIGSVLGGFFLQTFETHPLSTGTLWHSPFLSIFLFSGVLRLSASLILFFFVKEIKDVDHSTSWRVLRHFIGLSLSAEFGSRFVNVFLRKIPKRR